MKEIIALSADDRADVFNQAGTELGLQPFYVEKDFWVCWTLRVLFEHPEIGKHLTFRGGTSLSKGWGLISRFSEDIDLAIDRSMLKGIQTPAQLETNTAKRDRALKALRGACRQVITDQVAPAVREAAESLEQETNVIIEPLEKARDPFVILFEYPNSDLQAPSQYNQAAVKIELSGRADDWPSEVRPITPYVYEALPQLTQVDPIEVSCVQPARTFWEKASLLHEQNTRPDRKQAPARQSRHLYDLVRLWEHVTYDEAMRELFVGVKRHRSGFFNYGWVNYTKLMPGDLRLVPDEDQQADWRADYQSMQPMFFDSPPTFEALLEQLREIEQQLGQHE